MPLLAWDSSFDLNIDVIDKHHRQLVGLLNRSYDALRVNDAQRISLVLKELYDYTTYHFSTEEEMMLQYGFPSHAAHEQEHSRFSGHVNELQTKLTIGEALYNIQIVVFLKEWLLNHILVSDRELAVYLAAKGVV